MTQLSFPALRAVAAAALLAAAGLAQAPLNPGNLFVVRFGDGSVSLNNVATATFLDEYTTSGTLVQSIAMPTVASGSNQPLTNSGTAVSEGILNVTENGLYLTLAGYAAAPGLAAVAQTVSSATPRVIGRVDLLGQVDTSTTITDGYNGATGSNANIRSAVSVDGNAFWTSGTGAPAAAGVRYVALGTSTSVGLNAGAPSNVRVVGIYNGQLYSSSASTVYQSVCTVGVGLPTTPGQSIAVLPGLPTSSLPAPGPSAYDFHFASPTRLYIADDRSSGQGGIQRYDLVGGTWTLAYTLAPSATSGCRGLSGFSQGGVTTLWATTTNNLLVTVTDTGAASTFTTLATAPVNTAFRGLRYLPEPTTLQRLPGGCGTADIIAIGNGQIGTDVITTVLNPAGFGFVGYGLNAQSLPLFVFGCPSCIALHDFTFLAGGPQHILSLPNQPSLINLSVRLQGIDFLAPGPCTDPLLSLTDGYQFTIQ